MTSRFLSIIALVLASPALADSPAKEPVVLLEDPVERSTDGGTWRLGDKGWFSKADAAIGGLSPQAGRSFFLATNFPQNAVLTNTFPAGGDEQSPRLRWEPGTYVCTFEIGDRDDHVFLTETGGRGVLGGLCVGAPTDWKNALSEARSTGVAIDTPRPVPEDGWVTYTWTYTVDADATHNGESIVGQPLTVRLHGHNGGYTPDSGRAGNFAFDRLRIVFSPASGAEPGSHG
ncbi:MAG: hypothetical protein AAGJ36_03840, partial [Pseudomonadota bacterium]